MNRIKRVFTSIALTLCITLSLPQSTLGWGATGHKVIVRIAWENMKPATRTKVVAILRAAPADSGIPDLCKGSDLECLENVSVWADQVRGHGDPDRSKYSHPTWHYRDSFWEQTPTGPKDRPDVKPDAENAVTQLYYFDQALRKPASNSEKAIMVAWILHIGGDIHQPLHCSGRITSDDLQGDQGGNRFRLGERGNLHGYWDGIIDRVYPRNAGEENGAYYDRLAVTIGKDFPKDKFAGKLKSGDYEGWAAEGFNTTKNHLYPASLKRNEQPDADYQKMAGQIAEPAVALAGYRLADMLEHLIRD